jgi:gamma-polyglutamate synthase
MIIFLLSLMSFYAYTSWILVSYSKFKRQRNKIQWRIHVNGIRGKSTITRYTSAVFRAAGYHTFGKTTGSAARILRPNGEDYNFGRKGYPNVNEQVKILKDFSRQKAEVVVVECMAVNPVYQEWLEDKVMQSHIGIITNVRYDHMDYMGETLEEIAESLSKTIPQNGILITAETNPNSLNILEKNAKQKKSRIIIADRNSINVQDLAGFSHFAIEENVAIGLEIARLFKVPRDKAIKAMQQAVADPGAFSVEFLSFQQTQLAWANLFAVNDHESFVDLCNRLFKLYPDHGRIVILNNRHDRPTRVEQFAKLAQDLQFERVITFGDYESVVNKIFVGDPERVINLGNSSPFKDAAAHEMLQHVVYGMNHSKILLIGTVNIHTPQAEKLLHFFETQEKTIIQTTSEDSIQPQLDNVEKVYAECFE